MNGQRISAWGAYSLSWGSFCRLLILLLDESLQKGRGLRLTAAQVNIDPLAREHAVCDIHIKLLDVGHG